MDEWTKNWPVEAGSYWFFGHKYKNSKIALLFVRAVNTGCTDWTTGTNIVCIAEGVVLYKGQGAVGYFKQIKLPDTSLLPLDFN
jgi:hypothetical protein